MKLPAPDPSGATRERLVAAALTLFQSHGYHATGLSRILEAAGAPKGSLYHHFPGGKEALAIAVVESLERAMVRFFDRAAANAVTPEKCVARLFRDAAAWLGENGFRQGALLAVLAQEAGEGEPRLRQAVGDAYEAAIGACARALSPHDPQAASPLARTVLAALDGAVAMSRSVRSTEPVGSVEAVILPLVADWQRRSC